MARIAVCFSQFYLIEQCWFISESKKSEVFWKFHVILEKGCWNIFFKSLMGFYTTIDCFTITWYKAQERSYLKYIVLAVFRPSIDYVDVFSKKQNYIDKKTIKSKMSVIEGKTKPTIFHKDVFSLFKCTGQIFVFIFEHLVLS